MTRIFITGATGYIGGDILSQLVPKHPSFTYRLLVRGTTNAEIIKAQYPSVKIVSGSLDDSSILETESANADIIIHTADASDHLPAAKAIHAGILKGHSPQNPAYWLHTSGAGIFSYLDTDAGRYGKRGEKIFDDWDGIEEIVSIPDHAFHRDVDRFVLGAGEGGVRAAVVSPTTIYGRGRGPVSQRSRQLHVMATWVLERGKIPMVGEGRSIGSNVHIEDLTDLFLSFVDAALASRDDLWGEKAYYIAENGEHVWSDTARQIGDIAVGLGLVDVSGVEIVDVETAKEHAGFEAVSWGLNMRCRGLRARNVLGWRPRGAGVEGELEGIIRGEWEILQRQ